MPFPQRKPNSQLQVPAKFEDLLAPWLVGLETEDVNKAIPLDNMKTATGIIGYKINI